MILNNISKVSSGYNSIFQLMTLEQTTIQDLIIINPAVFSGWKGIFFWTYNEAKFHENGIKYNFIQDNQSFSTKRVIRNFTKLTFAQTKLVRVYKAKF
jgi:dTDP-4-dehydrorhamnose 3,5-epimerase